MPLNDDKHRAARRIKQLEKRITDLESSGQSETGVTRLITLEDAINIVDSVDSVEVYSLETGAWGETGWGTSTWSSNS